MLCNVLIAAKLCAYPGCGKQCYVEQDGTIHDYCSKSHAKVIPPPTGVPPTGKLKRFIMTNVLRFSTVVAGTNKCAIPECPNPCFVDGQGKVFECCGYTHAMELQRRKALAAGYHHIMVYYHSTVMLQ